MPKIGTRRPGAEWRSRAPGLWSCGECVLPGRAPPSLWQHWTMLSPVRRIDAARRLRVCARLRRRRRRARLSALRGVGVVLGCLGVGRRRRTTRRGSTDARARPSRGARMVVVAWRPAARVVQPSAFSLQPSASSLWWFSLWWFSLPGVFALPSTWSEAWCARLAGRAWRRARRPRAFAAVALSALPHVRFGGRALRTTSAATTRPSSHQTVPPRLPPSRRPKARE